jgi:Rieske Fe-S protein
LPDEPKKKESLLSRRDFIRNTVRLAVAGAIIPGAMSQVLPAVAPDALGGVGPGPVVRRDPTTNAKIPITLGELDGAPPVVLTAEWNFLPAVIYKVHKSTLQGSSDKRGYNTAMFALQHPTEANHAIMVYDGKCKHLGCTVGWNGGLGGSVDIPDYNEDGKNDGRILCPCHQGQYDIYNMARNVDGTPPPSPLNVIEFDIKSANDDLGNAVSNAIYGVVKYLQNSPLDPNGPQEAAAAADMAGTFPATDAEGNSFALDKFGLRAAGWSG